MSTWFRVRWEEIKPVEVEKVTDHFVTLKGQKQREARDSGYAKYFPSWDLAHAYMLERSEVAVRSARRTLEHANARLGNVKGMKRPAVSEDENAA